MLSSHPSWNLASRSSAKGCKVFVRGSPFELTLVAALYFLRGTKSRVVFGTCFRKSAFYPRKRQQKQASARMRKVLRLRCLAVVLFGDGNKGNWSPLLWNRSMSISPDTFHRGGLVLRLLSNTNRDLLMTWTRASRGQICIGFSP